MDKELEGGTSALQHRAMARIAKVTETLQWLRGNANSYVVFGDRARADRYVQFATPQDGAAEQHAVEAVALPLLVLVAAGAGAGHDQFVPIAQPSPGWSIHPFFGEPDHEPLMMEVGSGDWPEGSRRGLGDDPGVVAQLAALGLTIGGRSHGCPNFCREDVTEPSEVLASLVEDLMVRVLHARPTYHLTVKSGSF